MFKSIFIVLSILLVTACGDGKGDEKGSKPPVVDKDAPVITINGSNTVTLLVGDQYEELGATAKDNAGKDLEVKTSGSVDTTKAGKYVVTYSATDAAGKSSSAQRQVTVEEVRAFITTWDTRGNGFSADNQIMIDTIGDGYNYTVKWGDGKSDTNVTSDKMHTYDNPGIYQVEITGHFPRFYLAEVTEQAGTVSQKVEFHSDNHKLLTVKQWGNVKWASMSSMFTDAVNLKIEATDTPNISAVTDFSKMLSGTADIEYDITGWDVSNITNMSEMFAYSQFNQDISSWKVNKVVSMQGMFAGATKFNQNIGDWDVSNVADMSYMFSGATSFNQDIGSWNVAKVTNMKGMFGSNADYNYLQNIGFGAVGVTYFPRPGASKFNQNLNTWNVSNVTDMSNMFAGATSFNQNITSWNVAKVTNMQGMFAEATLFNQDLSTWSVANVTDMSFMFMKTAFNRDLSQWNVGNVVYMTRMFSEAGSFNQDVGDWDVTKVTEMAFMFDKVTLTSSNYNSLLTGWSRQQVKQNVVFHAGNSKYSGGARFARNALIDDFKWTITDGGSVN